MKHERIILIVFSAAVFALLIFWFFSSFERVTETVRSGYSTEALRNPFLAAERFLTKAGHEVSSVTGRHLLNDLPDSNDTLIINNFFSSLSKEKEQALLEWIELGGHLIVTPTTDLDVETATSGNSFFDTINVHRHTAGFDELIDYSVDEPVSFQTDEFDEDLQVLFHERQYLHAPEEEISGSIPSSHQVEDDGEMARYHLVQLPRGGGLITVVSDNRFLTNSWIGDYDHAMLLAMLVGDPAGKTWLLYDRNMPSLWSLMRQNLPALLFTFIATILLSIWHLSQRSGPIRMRNETVRRNLMEHLDARTRYLWRHGRQEATSGITRKLILDAWIKRHTHLGRLSPEEQCRWISRYMGIEESEIQQALFENTETTEQLVAQANILQLLELRIGHHPTLLKRESDKRK